MKIDECGRFSPSLSPLATSTPEKNSASQRTEGILQVEGEFSADLRRTAQTTKHHFSCPSRARRAAPRRHLRQDRPPRSSPRTFVDLSGYQCEPRLLSGRCPNVHRTTRSRTTWHRKWASLGCQARATSTSPCGCCEHVGR